MAAGGRRWKKPDTAVCKHPIDVENNNLDFAGAILRGLSHIQILSVEIGRAFAPRASSRENNRMEPIPPAGLPTLSSEDFYMDGSFMVFTAAYHLKRGYCCGSSCRHCPYDSAKAAARSKPDGSSHSCPPLADG